MVLFADNKYRYSLQWDAFSEEQIRAGQLMERLGNHKSKVVVPALIEYMERHPEKSTLSYSRPKAENRWKPWSRAWLVLPWRS